jgi:hypothetical protein
VKRFHFVALPLAEESPKSLLMRTVERNGALSISNLGARWNENDGPIGLAHLFGESALVSLLADEVGNNRVRFLSAFYQRRPGMTNQRPLQILNADVLPSWVRVKERSVCPACVKAGWFRAISDINFVDACPYHGCLTTAACPSCDKSFEWTKGSLHECPHCNANLRLISDEPVNAGGVQSILDYLRAGETAMIRKVVEALKAMRFPRVSTAKERNEVLNFAVRIAANAPGSMQEYLARAKLKQPGLPVRALAAPLLASSDPDFRKRINDILENEPSEFPKRCTGCACDEHQFTFAETRELLDVSTAVVVDLVKSRVLATRPGPGPRQLLFDAKPICQLFQDLAPKKSALALALEKRPLVGKGIGTRSIAEQIHEIRSGKCVVSSADARRGLTYVEVKSEAIKANALPKGYIGVAAAAQKLKTYPDAVRRVIKAGKLKIDPAQKIGTTVVIDERELDAFHRKYVFVGVLKEGSKAGSTILSAKLAHVGVFPISGPKIDGGLVALYARADIAKVDLNALDRLNNFKVNSGRKKGDPQLYDDKVWASAQEAETSLGLPPQQISSLVDARLLVEGKPASRIADNRRYFTRKSLKRCQEWLKLAVPYEVAAKKLNLTKHEFQLRFLRSNFVTPVKVGRKTLVGRNDFSKAEKHAQLYCTCAEADRYHGAPAKHFSNLVSTGRIQAVRSKGRQGVSSVQLLFWRDVRQFKSLA